MTAPARTPYPEDGDERSILLGYLAYYRDAVDAKCQGLAPDQLATRSAEPSALSLLGVVRHLCEMERVCGAWALSDDPTFEWVWGTYEDDGEPDIDCLPEQVEESFTTWAVERAGTDEQAARRHDLDQCCGSNGRTVRWNLHKLIGEYARHAGHADLLRERIDGATGE